MKARLFSRSGVVRARFFAVIAALFVSLAPAHAESWPATFTIGYQKFGSLIVLKQNGALDQRLKPFGVQIKWAEFPSGPQVMEAMNAGSVDFGIAGETPPVFAQAAAGSQLRYVAFEPPSPAGEAILVHQSAPIHTIADLKGKRVGVGKGTNAHYFLIRALASAGLSLGDIQPVYLKPADGNAAFLNGDIDAWAIWDYYLAVAQQAPDVRTLIDAQKLADNHIFLLSTAPFLVQHAKVVQAAVEELAKTDAWIQGHPADAAQLLSAQVGVAAPPLEVALKRAAYGPKALTPDVIAAQQRIADTLFTLSLLPQPVVVKDAVWSAP